MWPAIAVAIESAGPYAGRGGTNHVPWIPAIPYRIFHDRDRARQLFFIDTNII